ncbi:MAG: NAD-dependent epimerase/dehydratase family protein [Chitinivibrionales bacterium]|nr:NAD-dependent epimerase/dehydratase family protein [Chitinivibrionales bacterium]
MSSMSHSPQTICVLGCAGFIGSHLLARLLAHEHYMVLGIDREKNKIADLIGNPRFNFFNDDIKNESLVEWCIQRSDAVVSLTAICNPALYTQKPTEVIESNFLHPYKIAQICARHKKWLVQFSTSEVYGRTISSFANDATGKTPDRPSSVEANSDYILSEEKTPFILGPVATQRWSYACAKQLLERAVFALGFEEGLAFTIVRPFNFIGARMDYIPGIDGEGTPRVLACFMEALLKKKPLKLVDGGKNRRVFTYIEDAIDAVMAMLANPSAAKGQIFNIGNPTNEATVAELAALMIDCHKQLAPENSSYNYRTEDVSAAQFYGAGYEDSDRRMPDIAKAQKVLGWSPKTNLPETMRLTMMDYLKQYAHAA